jgi:hypothetical protein
MSEYEFEPVPGLPEALPPGEEILWQGAPRWQALARRAFHSRKVLFYFALLWVGSVGMKLYGGAPLGPTLGNSVYLAVPLLLVLVLLSLLALAMARTTLYTITNRRVVMRIGVALQMTINLPFTKIGGAALREYGDGLGDIPLALTVKTRVPYWVLWPHARPWHFSPAQPMLRSIPDVANVARTLAAALQRATERSAQADTAVDGASDESEVRINHQPGTAEPQARPT